MAHITATDRPTYFATQQGANVIHTGLIEKSGALATPLTVISGADENTFLGAAANKAGNYKPLPGAGAWVETGEIYGYGGGLVIVRQSHTRQADWSPETTPALFCMYRAGAGVLAWVAGEKVELGAARAYGGKTYEAIQPHVTQADWTPDKTPALWREVVENPTPGAWAVGVAYKVGDIVTYQGKTYQCLQAHTSQATWTPVAVPALWRAL